MAHVLRSAWKLALAAPIVLAIGGCVTNGFGPGSSAASSARSAQTPGVAVNAPPSQSLIGKGQSDLLALLGSPGLVRKDKGVEVWQYASASCVMLFYLYDDKSGRRRITYLEAMPPSPSASPLTSSGISPETCLADQMRALASKKTS